jgi:hypothetical protein
MATDPLREALERLVTAADAARAKSWVDVDSTRAFVAALEEGRAALAASPAPVHEWRAIGLANGGVRTHGIERGTEAEARRHAHNLRTGHDGVAVMAREVGPWVDVPTESVEGRAEKTNSDNFGPDDAEQEETYRQLAEGGEG